MINVQQANDTTMRDCDGDGDEKMEDANPSSEGPPHDQHLQKPLDEKNNDNNPHMHIRSSSSSSSIIDPFPLTRDIIHSFFGTPNYLRDHIRRRHEQERQDEKRQKLEHQQGQRQGQQPHTLQEHPSRQVEKEHDDQQQQEQHPPLRQREEHADHHQQGRCGIDMDHDKDHGSGRMRRCGENGVVNNTDICGSHPSVSSSTLSSGYLPPYLRYPTVQQEEEEQQQQEQEQDQEPGSSLAQTIVPSVLTPSTHATTYCGTPPTMGDDFPLERPRNRGRDSKEDDGAPPFEPIVRRDAASGVRWVQTPHTCAYVKAHLPDNSDWQTRLAGRLETERQKKAKTSTALRRHLTDPTQGYTAHSTEGRAAAVLSSAHFLHRHVSSSSTWSSGTLMDEEEGGPMKRTKESAMRRKEIRLMHTEGDRIGFAFQLLGRSIMFVRYKTDLYAVGTVCPHMQGDLSRGEVVPDIEDVSGSRESGGETRKPKIILVCPHHNWKFCLSTGQNVGDEKSADKSIPRYVIKVDEVNNEKYFFISGGDIEFLLDQRESKQPEPPMPEPSSWKQRRMLVRRQTHV